MSPPFNFMLWRDDVAKLIRRRNETLSSWEIVENYQATTDPGTGDDSADGYIYGSVWKNVTAKKVWVCTDPAAGAAVWKDLTAVGGGTQAFGTIVVSGQSNVVADAAPDTLTIVAGTGVTITTNATTDTITITPVVGSTSVKGIVQLAISSDTASGLVVQANDLRLSDARTPTAHATSHKSGGGDAIKLDELAATTDVTTLNVSTTAHGLMPKLNNNQYNYFTGAGTQTVLNMDGTSYVGISGGNLVLQGDTTDYVAYLRSSNYWQFVIGSAEVGHFEAGSDPGLRSPNVWFDSSAAAGVFTGIPYFQFDANDTISYDRTSNRINFTIGGSVVGYISSTGWHGPFQNP